MSELPDSEKCTCPDCGQDVAYVVSPNRISRGAPRETLIDFYPDKGSGGTIVVQVQGGKLYGDPAIPRKVQAMRAAGVPLYSPHTETCIKRNSAKNRS